MHLLSSYAPEPKLTVLILRALLQGKSLEQCKQKIKANYKETFVVGCFFWPAANLVNFRYGLLIH